MKRVRRRSYREADIRSVGARAPKRAHAAPPPPVVSRRRSPLVEARADIRAIQVRQPGLTVEWEHGADIGTPDGVEEEVYLYVLREGRLRYERWFAPEELLTELRSLAVLLDGGLL